MMLGFGWCHLQTSREPLRHASIEEVEGVDAKLDEADNQMFKAFRSWMAEHAESFVHWSLDEQNNNHMGLLTYSVSRNHRSSSVWGMLDWIRDNATGSYGLFYCHDDEDTVSRGAYNRSPPKDYDNVYRVHRLKNGKLEELDDPFFGLIDGDLGPVHPYERVQSTDKGELDVDPNA